MINLDIGLIISKVFNQLIKIDFLKECYSYDYCEYEDTLDYVVSNHDYLIDCSGLLTAVSATIRQIYFHWNCKGTLVTYLSSIMYYSESSIEANKMFSTW